MTGAVLAPKLQKLASGRSGRQVIVLPPAGGGFLPYLGMAAALAEHGDVHAVLAAGLAAGEEPDTDVPAMVARCLSAIRGLPAAPAVLAGWSLGGVLAWEVAAHLDAHEGHRPAVVLLDSYVRLRPDANLAAFTESIVDGWPASLPGPDRDRLLRTASAHVRAAADHEVSVSYAGPGLLLACADGPVAQQSAAWQRLSDQLRIEVVDGGHFGLLRPERLPAVTGPVGGFLHDVLGKEGSP
ncbi:MULTISPECIES: alpha/beta fold hydrolase [Amycolatopsis]|uniref:Alpha/beta fold hydrolase n=1 Tax=Amycolatopsis albidoflavus TaxID=102226 RepID=A0ABW5I0B0_9PSEU